MISRIFEAAVDLKDVFRWLAWSINGMPPAPHIVKARRVRQFGRRLDIQTLVETGTYRGDMVRKCLRRFRRIYSIELDPVLCRLAVKRFSNAKHVTIVCGDSATCLAKVLEGVADRCIFWLDGHFSGGSTARGKSECPILDELAAIARHPRKDHVLLIDDARLFGNNREYCTVEQLKDQVRRINSQYQIDVVDDCIICETPGGGSPFDPAVQAVTWNDGSIGPEGPHTNR